MIHQAFLARGRALLLPPLLAACASSGGPQVPGALYLSEVSFILTSDQVAADRLGSAHFSGFGEAVSAAGLTEQDIAAGRLVAIQGSIYWVNTASGIRHERLAVAVLPKGMQVDPGNVVEVRDPGHPHFYTVARIRARSLSGGRCGYVEMLAPTPYQITKDVLGLLALVGPSGSAALYCKGIENEGWVHEGLYWTRLPALAPASAR